MAPRTRVLAFGSAGLLVLAGAVCGVFVSGFIGELLAVALPLVGLGAALLLVFFEVGLSEDRELAREEERRRKRAGRRLDTDRRPGRWPRRPG
jgi:hypothetical protein